MAFFLGCNIKSYFLLNKAINVHVYRTLEYYPFLLKQIKGGPFLGLKFKVPLPKDKAIKQGMLVVYIFSLIIYWADLFLRCKKRSYYPMNKSINIEKERLIKYNVNLLKN